MDLNLELKIVDLPIQHNENFYSPELKNIILKMIEKDKSKRPTSEQALNMLIQEFNKKYAKVSSIGSVLCGLYSLKELSDYFTKNENQTFIQNNKQNKPISFSFLYGINCIKNIVNIDWNSSLYNIKSIFTEDNNIYSENKEMDPRHILSYLLRKMNKELAQQKNNIQRADTIDLEDINKDKALQKFLNLSFNNSPIFQFFYGLMKSKSLCCKCNTTTYSFNYYYFVSFNVELVLNTQQMNPSIEQLFNIQNNVLVKLHQSHHKNCNNCKCVQEFLQRKQFYTLPPFLIVCLDRGYNCEFKSKISYNLQLNLANEVEKKMITFYELTAIVKRADRNDKEHYICIYKDFNVNSWVLRDDSKTFKLNSPFDSNEGIEMIFFYRRLQNNSVIKQQSTF